MRKENEPKKRIRLVVDGVRLEAESRLLRRLAEDGASWSLDEVLPVEAVVRPAVTEAGWRSRWVSEGETGWESGAYDRGGA